MKALVTGATGYLGTPLVASLAAAGADVVGVAPEPAGDAACRLAVLDVRDRDTVVELFERERPDVAWHLASLAQGRRDPDFIVPVMETEVLGALSVLEGARRAGCRVVHAGSVDEPRLLEEAVTPYAAAKAAAALVAGQYRRLAGLEVVHLRLHMVYGPGDRSVKMLVPYVIEELLAGRVPAIRDPERLVDWLYVEDAVEALVRAGTAPDASGAPIDVGTGTVAPVREVVGRVAALLGAPVELPPAAPSPFPTHVASVERARDLLGWQARTPLAEGLERTAAWWRRRAGAAVSGA